LVSLSRATVTAAGTSGLGFTPRVEVRVGIRVRVRVDGRVRVRVRVKVKVKDKVRLEETHPKPARHKITLMWTLNP
jgi:hypothetical protein